MPEKKKRAAGYIRVSSIGQIENESLGTQRAKISNYCKSNRLKLFEIYADEGISGGTVSERIELKRALRDARNKNYDVLIVNDLSRFGRNARELLNNFEVLSDNGVELVSIKDEVNFSKPIGKTMLIMLSAIAELELTMIKERMSENRIAKALRGVPTSGKLPFGRTFDEVKEEWKVIPIKKEAINWVADQYLKGLSLQDLAMKVETRYTFKITYPYIATVLKEQCGTDWSIFFKEYGKPIHFKIPRLLPESTIKAVKDRLAHNRTNNRTDTREYLLTGFIRCMNCGKSMSGQTQTGYQYYVHSGRKDDKCEKKVPSIRLDKIEPAVFQTIFENIFDKPSFDKAIKESLPDTEYVNRLEKEKIKLDKNLGKIEKEIKNLVRAVKKGILPDGDIQEDRELLEKDRIEVRKELSEVNHSLGNLPDFDKIIQEADNIRKELMRHYQSEEHLDKMSFEQKKQLLHFLFDGKAPNGDHYGIYVDKRGKGKEEEIDYFLYGRLTGLRTIKGNDIEYYPEDEDFDLPKPINNSETPKATKRKGKRPMGLIIDDDENSAGSKSDFTHKISHYKTKIFSVMQKYQKI